MHITLDTSKPNRIPLHKLDNLSELRVVRIETKKGQRINIPPEFNSATLKPSHEDNSLRCDFSFKGKRVGVEVNLAHGDAYVHLTGKAGTILLEAKSDEYDPVQCLSIREQLKLGYLNVQ